MWFGVFCCLVLFMMVLLLFAVMLCCLNVSLFGCCYWFWFVFVMLFWFEYYLFGWFGSCVVLVLVWLTLLFWFCVALFGLLDNSVVCFLAFVWFVVLDCLVWRCLLLYFDVYLLCLVGVGCLFELCLLFVFGWIRFWWGVEIGLFGCCLLLDVLDVLNLCWSVCFMWVGFGYLVLGSFLLIMLFVRVLRC